MFALSTSWNASSNYQASEIVDEIKSLGFEKIELSFNLTSTMVEDMIGLKKLGAINICSVHNFCPIPAAVPRKMASPDMFSLAALDEAKRAQAVRYTKNSIETASRIGAEALVLHLGNVNLKERLRELAAIYAQGRMRQFEQLKQGMIRARQRRAQRFLPQTMKSLDELCSYAQKSNIKLGIENRFYFYEIPSFEEMEIILNTFPGPPLYYWHDVGHAQVNENLGLAKHKAFLEKFSPRMAGIHLHDCAGSADHLAPLKGKFDFTLLKPYLQAETLKVMEPHYPAKAEEIIQGRIYLEKLFGND